MKQITHTQVKKELLKNPETLAAYDDLKEEYHLINQMLHARKRIGFTQAKIAKQMKTTTSAISRLESFSNKVGHSPTLNTLRRYAGAVN